MAIHESSCPPIRASCVPNGPCANVSSSATAAALKLTISAPAPFTNERRDNPAPASASRASGVMRITLSAACLAVARGLFRRAKAGIPLDGAQHPCVREAPAQHGRERLLDLRVGGIGRPVEKRLRGQDDAVQAEAALRSLLVDERLLNRVRLRRRPESFERRDLGAVKRGDRCDAGPDGAAPHDHCAGTALAEPAAELRPVDGEVVAEDVQQRRGRIDINSARTAVDGQRNHAHGGLPGNVRAVCHSFGPAPRGTLQVSLMDLSAVSGLLVALLGGAAIGVERQRTGHASGRHARLGGVRTFTLLGGLSGLAGWMSTVGLPAGTVMLAGGAVALVVAGYVAASRREVDATTEVAALV